LDHALDTLNALPPDEAGAEFLKCCGSMNWARQIASARPFENVDALLDSAANIWWSLAPDDWLAAFRSHPKIGERQAERATSTTAHAWSEQEQSGINGAAQETTAALAAGNLQYEQRFGYIFIVCASGKSADEMLAILRARLPNDPDQELRIAAGEQAKITSLRLQKLIADS
jgi:2-oxo-4-hydroxy-4-carboxy-5-ureidoimidazoline decarboxylase